MKSIFVRARHATLSAWLACCLVPLASSPQAAAQPTAFTYQGRLDTTNGPANGTYDFTFTLYATNTGGAALTATAASNVRVRDGLFASVVDFGSAEWFKDDDRWLELAVRPSGIGTPVVLVPRQKFDSTPYAMRSGSAEAAITAPWSGLSGVPTGFTDGVDNDTTYLAGAGLNLFSNAFTLNTNFTHTIYWRLTGNAATTAGVNFLGTTDNEPLELKVNGQRTMRFEPVAGGGPNVIGGSSANTVTAGSSAVVIGGGDGNQIFGDFDSIGGGEDNRVLSYADGQATVSAIHSVISGGLSNTITGGVASAVGGGRQNRIVGNNGRQVHFATIGGGLGNAVLSDSFNSFYSVIGGGLSNRVSTAGRATIGGGGENRILLEGHRATIGGGADNVIDGSGSTISGGESNSILGPGNPDFATIGGGEENGIIAECHYSTVAGGRANLIEGFSRYSSVGGGVTNTVLGADFGTIGGGATNSVTGHFAVVPGGRQNRAESNDSLAAGRRAVAAHAGSFVWADSTDADFSSLVPNEVALRASGGMRVIGSPTNAVLMVAPNETGSGDDSQITLGEDLDGTFGMSIRYDGGPNELQIYGHSGNTLFGPHVVITRNAGNVGIGRVPAANALEVEGAASKTVAGDWLANSDARIKQDIQPVQDALETLNRVRLVSFRYTDAYASSHPAVEDRRYLNVVAQEFAEVFPEHVKRSGERLPDGSEILQVDAYPLTIYSAAAVQELSRMLEVRQKEITELKQTVAELARVVQAMNDKLEGGAQ